MFRAGAEKLSRLEGNETQREVGAHGLLADRAAVGIDARRDVERQHWPLRRIDGADHLEGLGPGRRTKTRAQQAIDDDIAVGQRATVEGMRIAARRQPVFLCAARVAGELVRRHRRQHQGFQAHGLREARQHIAIATIVSGATDHGHAPPLRPAGTQQLEGALGRARHQRVSRHAPLLDFAGIECADLGGRIDGRGLIQGPVHGAGIILTASHEPRANGRNSRRAQERTGCAGAPPRIRRAGRE
jgi:hypothetical protein